MIKDLIVNLSVAPIRDVAGEFAVSIAAAFEAHVAGVAFVYEPAPPMLTMGTIPADLLSRLRKDNENAAKAAIATFDAQARRAGLSAETRAVEATFLGAPDYFARAARRFDLAVVGQAERDKVAPEELIAEAALFDSGRPVVVVPYIQKAGLELDRVMVCWDAGRNAARAIADAMPFLDRRRHGRQCVRQGGRGGRGGHRAAPRPPRAQRRGPTHLRPRHGHRQYDPVVRG